MRRVGLADAYESPIFVEMGSNPCICPQANDFESTDSSREQLTEQVSTNPAPAMTGQHVHVPYPTDAPSVCVGVNIDTTKADQLFVMKSTQEHFSQSIKPVVAVSPLCD